MSNLYRAITFDERVRLENDMMAVMSNGFEELEFSTWEWLSSDAAREVFIKRNQRLSTFFRESGINDKWNEIIEVRAQRGTDIVEYIYDYARRVNMSDYVVEYTRTERRALNRLCDYNYELIRNVTQDEVTAIRRQLVKDYANNTYPLRTSLKELSLQPINGWSPLQRAEVIARTETARTLNVSTLTTFMGDGVTHVELQGCDPTCDECSQYMAGSQEYPDGVPIEEAMKLELPHPNCTGTWTAVANSDGLYVT